MKEMTAYFLSNHIYVRINDDGATLLDLNRDEYSSLTPQQAGMLTQLLRGWPDTAGKDECQAADLAALSEFATMLLRREILTTNIQTGKTLVEAEISKAITSLTDNHADSLHRRPAIRHFVLAYARARFSLRLRSIRNILAAIARRKAQRADRMHACESSEVEAAVSDFLCLRPYFYTQVDKCLLDSLTMIHYLADLDVFPTLVFGVRTRPFEAHAWVQYGESVLNFPTDYVNSFSPILTI